MLRLQFFPFSESKNGQRLAESKGLDVMRGLGRRHNRGHHDSGHHLEQHWQRNEAECTNRKTCNKQGLV
jgi:hypothetical protein